MENLQCDLNYFQLVFLFLGSGIFEHFVMNISLQCWDFQKNLIVKTRLDYKDQKSYTTCTVGTILICVVKLIVCNTTYQPQDNGIPYLT